MGMFERRAERKAEVERAKAAKTFRRTKKHIKKAQKLERAVAIREPHGRACVCKSCCIRRGGK